MKLTREDIQFINHFLINRGIKYIDVRVELIDHLSSDFEENSNYGLLEDYLKSKTSFISEFEKNRHSQLHWFYQRQLWVQFFKHFYTIKGLVKSIAILLTMVMSLQLFEIKTVASIALVSAGLINIGSMFTYFRQRKAINKTQSSILIFAILSLPSLPLYAYSQINAFVEGSALLFVPFWMTIILLNISGAQLVYKLKKNSIENYNKLISA